MEEEQQDNTELARSRSMEHDDTSYIQRDITNAVQQDEVNVKSVGTSSQEF